jgi:hypothetical protein
MQTQNLKVAKEPRQGWHTRNASGHIAAGLKGFSWASVLRWRVLKLTWRCLRVLSIGLVFEYLILCGLRGKAFMFLRVLGVLSGEAVIFLGVRGELGGEAFPRDG